MSSSDKKAKKASSDLLSAVRAKNLEKVCFWKPGWPHSFPHHTQQHNATQAEKLTAAL